MAVDTPAKIAVIGAGPIGLEAALYARFLGYEVVIYERGDVAHHVQRWGHVRMFSPFGMNRSPLGLAALAAQDETYTPPDDDELLTGSQYVERYLRPLAESDLLSDALRLQHEVLSVGRETFLKGELPGAEERGEFDFRLLIKDNAGQERIEHADVLIDASGVLRTPNWLGSSGVPAPGERRLAAQIDYHLPDILGRDRERFAGQHTLLIGAGMSAATTATALAQLATESPQTRVTWISRREPSGSQRGPVSVLENDPLPERRKLAESANALRVDDHPAFRYAARTDVEAISQDAEGRFQVELSGQLEGIHAFDRIVANVGYRPNLELVRELQVETCFATEGRPNDRATLVQPEPNFYILGAKSAGRDSSWLIADGLRQIVDVFRIIGDRETLDLYASARLPR